MSKYVEFGQYPRHVRHGPSDGLLMPKDRFTRFELTSSFLAIINIYGRNVINADGDVWRFHRRVTGPVFSERIHHAVWEESTNQAHLMMQSWLLSRDLEVDCVHIPSFGDDTLRLGLNVITGAAYGCPLGWNESPPCASSTSLSYHASVEQLNAHLMSIFLTPRWLLRLAWRDSTWGRAWEAYTAFGGYMRGMLDRQRAHLNVGDDTEENLLTALIRAEDVADEKDGRNMNAHEVMGNAFIFLFAGHETTANTLHYTFILLAQRPDIQQFLLDEVDDVYERAAQEGRRELEYELDFNRARWTFAIMVREKHTHTIAASDFNFSAAVRNPPSLYPNWHDKQVVGDGPAHNI